MAALSANLPIPQSADKKTQLVCKHHFHLLRRGKHRHNITDTEFWMLEKVGRLERGGTAIGSNVISLARFEHVGKGNRMDGPMKAALVGTDMSSGTRVASKMLDLLVLESNTMRSLLVTAGTASAESRDVEFAHVLGNVHAERVAT